MKLLAHGARPRFLLPLGSRSVWGSCTARRESATEWMNRTVHADTLTHTLTQTTTTTHTHTLLGRTQPGSWSGDEAAARGQETPVYRKFSRGSKWTMSEALPGWRSAANG